MRRTVGKTSAGVHTTVNRRNDYRLVGAFVADRVLKKILKYLYICMWPWLLSDVYNFP